MARSKQILSCQLIFDGGSVGNPGDCYGSFRWKIADGPLSRPSRRRFGYGTNNQAEYWALIEGLAELIEELSTSNSKLDEVALEIRGDSSLMGESDILPPSPRTCPNLHRAMPER